MEVSNKIELVKERLEFIEMLNDVKEHFRGINKIVSGKNQRDFKHPYKHFSALQFYLALTCFDILGQADDWIDYGSWLSSKKKAFERNNIIAKHQEKELNDFLVSINKEYNEIYGVKKSFINFIRDVISNQNRTKLFDSINGSEVFIVNEIINEDGSIKTFTNARRIELNQKQKEDFLFNIRNSFTHKGISIGDIAGGIIDIDKPVKSPFKENPVWPFRGIHYQKINGNTIMFSIRRWPFILIEIIENTILEFNERQA